MSVQNVFGQLLLNVSKSLMRLSIYLGKMGMNTERTSTKDTEPNSRILIWDVIDGPFNREEFDEYDLLNEGLPDHLNFMLVVLIEDEGELEKVDFWYETEEEALEVVKYFKEKIEPLGVM
jgi:hypothetical protein